MYAPQPSRPPEPLRPRVRRSAKRSQLHRAASDRKLAAEVSTKIIVNLSIAAVSGIALATLIPRVLQQQAQLQDLQAEVTYLETEVNSLRDEFSGYFDTNQTQRLAQEEGQWLKTNQRRVIWLEPSSAQSSQQLAHQ